MNWSTSYFLSLGKGHIVLYGWLVIFDLYELEFIIFWRWGLQSCPGVAIAHIVVAHRAGVPGNICIASTDILGGADEGGGGVAWRLD